MGWSSSNFAGGFPRVLFGFSAGVVIYRLWSRPSLCLALQKRCPAFLLHPAVIYALVLCAMCAPPVWVAKFYFASMALVCPVLIALGSMAEARAGFQLRLAQTLGMLSYPIYCLHFPIARTLCLMLRSDRVWGYPAVLCVALTVLISILLVRYYDEPLRRRLLRSVRKPLVAAAAASGR